MILGALHGVDLARSPSPKRQRGRGDRFIEHSSTGNRSRFNKRAASPSLARRARPLALIFCSLLVAAPCRAQDTYEVGIGKADITPREAVWMAGYGGRKQPSQGADHPLHVKALAVRSGKEPPLLLITAD